MRRSLYAVCLGCLLCLMPTSSANAQTLDLTYNFQRAFDIPSESWMNFHVPGVEVQAKGFTFGSYLFLDEGGKKSEADYTVKYDRSLMSKLNINAWAGGIRYFMDFVNPVQQRKNDWNMGVQVRYRLLDR